MKWIDVPKMKQLYRLVHSKSPSYLVQTGWFESAISRRPIDAQGQPLPWLSYPFLEFIRPRLGQQMTVIEFGAGHSTLFWASRVGKVYSIEHDAQWFSELERKVPANVTLTYQAFDEKSPAAYAGAADKLAGAADIVLVDGPERNLTLRNAVRLLRDGGVIVLDNGRRREYADACTALTRDAGFRRLDFVGMGPSAVRECVTSLFYRDANCLGV